MMQALLFVVLAGIEWWRWYSGMKPNPVIFSLAAAAAVGYAALRFFRVRPQLTALRLGEEGEKAVGQFLERLRGSGFQVFHDVVGPGFNVDHVLVGPQGLFTVETKTWSKPSSGNPRIVFDGDTLKVGARSPERDPISQARAQASWLRGLLAESSGRSVQVRPVIAFPGWYVETTGRSTDVWVLEPKALPHFIETEPSRLSPEDARLLAYHLSRYVRSSQAK